MRLRRTPAAKSEAAFSRFASVAVCVGLCVSLGSVARAGVPSDEPQAGDRIVVTKKSGRKVLLFPPGHLFKPYIADPHTPQSALMLRHATGDGVADSGSGRFDLRLGGRFGFFRWDPKREGGRAWQLSLDAGLDAQFDMESSLDNIGWDGNYGLSLTTAAGGPWMYRVGTLHTSSHVGDEYAERTGRRRIGYTREELVAAVGRRFARHWRTYGELGWDPTPKKEAFQEPFRVQGGLEIEVPGRFWKEHMGWFAALDLQGMEELDWGPDAAFRIGFFFDSGGRRWRTALELYDGRVPLGEFYRVSETYVSIGIWADL